MKAHLQVLDKEINWLIEIIQLRKQDEHASIPNNEMENSEHRNEYEKFILQNDLSIEERLLLILTIVPHLYPDLLENKLLYYFRRIPAIRADWMDTIQEYSRGAFLEQDSKFGLIRGASIRAALPTGQTFLYLAVGYELSKKTVLMSQIFQKKLFLLQNDIIQIKQGHIAEPYPSGVLYIQPRYLISFIGNIPLENIDNS